LPPGKARLDKQGVENGGEGFSVRANVPLVVDADHLGSTKPPVTNRARRS
jgi:hypothetical protein